MMPGDLVELVRVVHDDREEHRRREDEQERRQEPREHVAVEEREQARRPAAAARPRGCGSPGNRGSRRARNPDGGLAFDGRRRDGGLGGDLRARRAGHAARGPEERGPDPQRDEQHVGEPHRQRGRHAAFLRPGLAARQQQVVAEEHGEREGEAAAATAASQRLAERHSDQREGEARHRDRELLVDLDPGEPALGVPPRERVRRLPQLGECLRAQPALDADPRAGGIRRVAGQQQPLGLVPADAGRAKGRRGPIRGPRTGGDPARGGRPRGPETPARATMMRSGAPTSSPRRRKTPSKARPSGAARSKKNVMPGRGSRKVRGATRFTMEVAATRVMAVCSASFAGGRTTL